MAGTSVSANPFEQCEGDRSVEFKAAEYNAVFRGCPTVSTPGKPAHLLATGIDGLRTLRRKHLLAVLRALRHKDMDAEDWGLVQYFAGCIMDRELKAYAERALHK